MSKKPRPRERVVEKYLSKKIYRLGGLCYKWRAQDNKGVPDRVCMLPWIGLFLVEVKAIDGSTTRLQEFTFNRMKKAGAIVFVTYGHDGVDALIEYVLKLKESIT